MTAGTINAERAAAAALVRKAKSRGIPAWSTDHPRQGWVCMVRVPFDDRPRIVRDETDLPYVLADMRDDAAPVAA